MQAEINKRGLGQSSREHHAGGFRRLVAPLPNVCAMRQADTHKHDNTAEHIHIPLDATSAAGCFFEAFLDSPGLSLFRPSSPATAASSEASGGLIYLFSAKSSTSARISMTYGNADNGTLRRCALVETAREEQLEKPA